MPYPNDFLYAFAKLERAIEELVGAGEVKDRLDAAARASFMIFAEDFPPDLQDEYRAIHEALTWLPGEDHPPKGTAETTLESMTEDEAAALSKRLLSFYIDAAEVYHKRLAGY